MSSKLRCPHCGGALKVGNRRISELAAQLDALKEIAKQNLCSEMPLSELDVGDIEAAYDQCILTARTALQGGSDE